MTKPIDLGLDTSGMDEAISALYREVMGQREEICKAFIAKYGYLPDEVEQVQQQTESGPVWFVRHRLHDEARSKALASFVEAMDTFKVTRKHTQQTMNTL